VLEHARGRLQKGVVLYTKVLKSRHAKTHIPLDVTDPGNEVDWEVAGHAANPKPIPKALASR